MIDHGPNVFDAMEKFIESSWWLDFAGLVVTLALIIYLLTFA